MSQPKNVTAQALSISSQSKTVDEVSKIDLDNMQAITASAITSHSSANAPTANGIFFVNAPILTATNDNIMSKGDLDIENIQALQRSLLSHIQNQKSETDVPFTQAATSIAERETPTFTGKRSCTPIDDEIAEKTHKNMLDFIALHPNWLKKFSTKFTDTEASVQNRISALLRAYCIKDVASLDSMNTTTTDIDLCEEIEKQIKLISKQTKTKSNAKNKAKTKSQKIKSDSLRIIQKPEPIKLGMELASTDFSNLKVPTPKTPKLINQNGEELGLYTPAFLAATTAACAQSATIDAATPLPGIHLKKSSAFSPTQFN